MARFLLATVCAVLVLASTAAASPVATDDGSYSVLGAVFPDPLAGCQNSGGLCDPKARGNVAATTHIGYQEFIDGILYMNQNKAKGWGRYMEIYALDGHLGDGSNTRTQVEA